MRVLIAPDCFGATLSAQQAAEAIASGWRAAAPGEELVLRPQADGGPGFVEVLAGVLGGSTHTEQVTGPLGDPVTATWLADGDTGYIESAQACGLPLVPAGRRPWGDTTGVGELVRRAVQAGMRTVVVGLGGSATTDGGCGLLAALGVRPLGDRDEPLPPTLHAQRLGGQVALDDVRLLAATDVDNVLLGEHGAARGFGPQKGADAGQVEELESLLTGWADLLGAHLGRDHRDDPGAGAAGGLGLGLFAAGASRVSGAALVRELTGLDAALDEADLVITGEGSFDWQSLRGKLVTSVAAGAAERGVPCLVLAGQVSVGRRQAASIGVDTAYSVSEHVGSTEASLADPAGTLTSLARHVAAGWTH